MKKIILFFCMFVLFFVGFYRVTLKPLEENTVESEKELETWIHDIKVNLSNTYKKVAVGERKTNEEQYQKVEKQLIQDQRYLKKLENKFLQLHETFQKQDFLDKNIKEDGPLFKASVFFLDDSITEYNSIRKDVLFYLSEESIKNRAKQLQIKKEFEKIYIEYVNNYFGYLTESFISNLPTQVEALMNIFFYLRHHEDDWAVYDEGILFDSQEYVDEFQMLINDFEVIQREDNYE